MLAKKGTASLTLVAVVLAVAAIGFGLRATAAGNTGDYGAFPEDALDVGPLVYVSHEYEREEQVDCGEDIDMIITLRNQGTDLAKQVSATISEDDQFVTVEDDSSNYNDIFAGATAKSNDYEFSVDASTPDGHVITFNMNITTSDGGTWTDSFTVPVSCGDATQYGVELTPSAAQSVGNLNSTVSYTLHVTNTGTAADTYDVTVSGNNWTTNVPSTVGPLAAGAGQDIQVAVDVPLNATPGTQDVAIVRVRSQGDSTVTGNSTLKTIVAKGTHGVSVVPSAEAKFSAAGTTVKYSIRVTNMGTTADTYDVAVSGNSWTTDAPNTVGPLAPGAGQDIQVAVDIPTAAAPGAVDLATVRVTSQGDTAVSADATLATVSVIQTLLPIVFK
jgi:hypothetical protein